jgi:hypothetical protein
MESSYGNALALQGPILAVGAPGGAGFVDIRRAVGPEVGGVKPLEAGAGVSLTQGLEGSPSAWFAAV